MLSADLNEMRQLDGRGFLANTERRDIAWQDEYLIPSDLPQIKAFIDRAISEKVCLSKNNGFDKGTAMLDGPYLVNSAEIMIATGP